MISRYDSGQSLSATACEFGFTVSIVNSIKNSARIKECVIGLAMMKLKIITEKHVLCMIYD
jgi:hypothetical protein